MDDASQVCLAIDMGGSKFMVGLVDRVGTVIAKRRCLWSGLTASQVAEDILREAHALLKAHPQVRPSVIGATIPGLADPKTGVWIEASFSGIRNLPVSALLSAEFALPAYADNDAKACALAEKLFGAGQDCDDFLYVTVSNGIGGAWFLDGRIYNGANGCAGELGHVNVVAGGRRCGCGCQGCLEKHAAGPGIMLNYGELGGTAAKDGQMPDAKEIADRARQGEQVAQRTWQMVGQYLGRSIATAANLINPRKVIIGGGVSLAFDLFAPALMDALQANLYRKANPNLAVVPTGLGYDGALLGAAAVSFCRQERLFQ